MLGIMGNGCVNGGDGGSNGERSDGVDVGGYGCRHGGGGDGKDVGCEIRKMMMMMIMMGEIVVVVIMWEKVLVVTEVMPLIMREGLMVRETVMEIERE